MLKLYQQLLHNRVLSDAEPRHYSSWNYPTYPRLNGAIFIPSEQEHHRRQKLHAPQLGGRRGLRLFINALRSR
ncbi:MAG: hypothetical protein SFY80_04415 [Verrucomicrobiota bacterium]|nr:hypothetical protein [Verrucomicrobiota bacterium]